MSNLSVGMIQAMIREAKEAAYEAADNLHKNVYGGRHEGPCGFAWVNIYRYNGKNIDGRSKIGKLLKEAGMDRNWWNPSGYPVQNLHVLEEGAEAAAHVLAKYGFEAYAGSRLD